MKLKPIILKSERLILRKFKLSDVKQYIKLGSHIKDTKKALAWIKSSWIKNSYHFGIFLKENNILIGKIELCHMDWWFDKAGEIGYFINKKYRGKGYATKASGMVIDYCFDKLNFHKMYADTDPDNFASQKVLEKLGFKLEGRIREKVFVKGKWIDEYDYGLLKTEWKK